MKEELTLRDGIIDDGGEGIILRKVGSLYEHGRSLSLIKLKMAQGDEEGIVVGIGALNSVKLRMADGRSFVVPAHNVLIATPTVGDIVSYSFETNARRELPNNPKIYRIRTDLSWDDVLLNAAKDKKFLNDSSNRGFTSRPLGHWSKQNMQLFLESFAKSMNLDPLLPETWYDTSRSSVSGSKGGDAVLRKFKGGFFHTLLKLFPSIGLDRLWWYDIRKRRRVLENYALQKGFDPHIPKHWYSQSKEEMLSKKSIKRVLWYYQNSLPGMLLDLFPNIGLDKSKFPGFRVLNRNRREFFEKYAKAQGFNPHAPENWYSVSRATIMACQGAHKVISYHGNNIARALLDLFPNIGLEWEKLQDFWDNMDNRKQFFEKYAESNSFDPNNPENWYLQPRKRIMASKGAANVLAYHDNSIPTALLDLFPNIGLDRAKFSTSNLMAVDRRRQFFIDFAATNNFDPLKPENWYSVSRKKIKSSREGCLLMDHYSSSLSKALIDLFPNIGLDKDEFLTPALWRASGQRRKFFEDIALENGFDPLLPENWYSQEREMIMAVKGAHSVSSYHGYSITKALLELFPEIGLDPSRLYVLSKSSWNEVKKRSLFESYARENGFDPRSPEGWYRQPREKILAMKGVQEVLLYNKKSVSVALLELFPNIGLEKSRLRAAKLNRSSVG